MSKTGLMIVVALSFCAGLSARASLVQTLVLFRAPTGITIFGATPEDRENRINYPVVAMTKRTAEFLATLTRGQIVRCEFEAFKQDYGKSTREVVWSVYSVDAKTCTAGP